LGALKDVEVVHVDETRVGYGSRRMSNIVRTICRDGSPTF